MIKKRQYLVKNPNKVFEGTKFQILLEELKGQSLSNAIEYWCMANDKNDLVPPDLNPPGVGRAEENLKAIEDKISELNTLLNE
jgi:hypothetical protein